MSSMSNADEPRNLRSDSMSAMATPLQLIACLVYPHAKYYTLRASCNMHRPTVWPTACSMHHTPHSTHHNTQHAAGSMWRHATYCNMRGAEVRACVRKHAWACMYSACIACARILGVRKSQCALVRACVRACVRARVRVRVHDQRALIRCA